MPFFGFIPSAELLTSIQTGQEKKNSSEPLYPLRDKTALLINDEIIDGILTELIRRFPFRRVINVIQQKNLRVISSQPLLFY